MFSFASISLQCWLYFIDVFNVLFHCAIVCGHVFGCVTVSACRGANVPSCARVVVPYGAREEMARPSKKK